MNPNKKHDWLELAWNDYIDGFTALFPVLLLLTLFSAPVFYSIDRWHSYFPALLYALLLLAPLTTGSNLVYIRLARGEKPPLITLFSAFRIYHRAVAVTLLLGLMTVAGTLLFILPGLIIYSTYCLSEYTVVDRRSTITESFKLSAEITRGWRGVLGFVVLLTIMIDMLAPNPVYVTGKMSEPVVKLNLKPWIITAFFLKTFVFLPWLHIAMARIYNTLIHKHRQPAMTPPAQT
ncbi:MAG: hypothetical protein A2234_05380 [Elusimicrobia bacterium RIFOXYA2_FULL_58_8]|nr:MAG: hypothetical protein A2285_02240 [Elusimicrobia bacterium RIFOXYA12_FULL_57_11]OGS17327.1 MAG: hypothetical protein A2234_05380 [Elusimicrobia bacterium RIFOXYA2_FULL_58_8]